MNLSPGGLNWVFPTYGCPPKPLVYRRLASGIQPIASPESPFDTPQSPQRPLGLLVRRPGYLRRRALGLSVVASLPNRTALHASHCHRDYLPQQCSWSMGSLFDPMLLRHQPAQGVCLLTDFYVCSRSSPTYKRPSRMPIL
ncbi:hypothetical protein GUJ93_ZPchr0012g19001 [Zizania palustris]|uniref:Uncharacterized protein n=1 Tax=Zizania palustris TaxID=103762 RepID=A0A8J5WPU7_ZIZPA|nr:hypothetical protein GUJ93_ZPchr0012g19001 [Zizania palustris]